MATTPRISPRANAARTTPAGADVIGTRPDATALAPVLRTALGFRVDGPDGRIGVLRGLAPAAPAAPEQLLVARGLFLVTTVSIRAGEVRSVDSPRRRIVVARAPQLPRRNRVRVARRIRRLVRRAVRAAHADAPKGV